MNELYEIVELINDEFCLINRSQSIEEFLIDEILALYKDRETLGFSEFILLMHYSSIQLLKQINKDIYIDYKGELSRILAKSSIAGDVDAIISLLNKIRNDFFRDRPIKIKKYYAKRDSK